MPSRTAGIGKLIVEQAPTFVRNYGPTLMKAVEDVRRFMKDHPALPEWAQERLNDLAKQVEIARTRRGDAAQARALLDVLRTQVTQLDPSVDAGAWVQRADNIQLRIGIAEQLGGTVQRTKLAELKTESESLLAEFVDALAYVPPAQHGEPEQAESITEEPDASEDQPHQDQQHHE